MVKVIAKESVNHDCKTLGTTLGKEVGIIHTVLVGFQFLYPTLYGLQPVVKGESHEETDVQVLLQAVVAGRQATAMLCASSAKRNMSLR